MYNNINNNNNSNNINKNDDDDNNSWIIPLDKNPGIRTIGEGEVLRRIIGKTITAFLKEEIKQAAEPLQVCVGHSQGGRKDGRGNEPVGSCAMCDARSTGPRAFEGKKR